MLQASKSHNWIAGFRVNSHFHRHNQEDRELLHLLNIKTNYPIFNALYIVRILQRIMYVLYVFPASTFS